MVMGWMRREGDGEMCFRVCTCPITELLHNTNQFPSNNLDREASIKNYSEYKPTTTELIPQYPESSRFVRLSSAKSQSFNNERVIMSKGETGIFHKDLIVFHDSANC